MKYFIKTYGCQMNISDSQRVKTLLDQNNLEEVQKAELADLIVVNTCSVRQKAEEKVIGWVNKFKNSNQTFIIIGCMIQRDYKNDKCDNTYKNINLLKRKFKVKNIYFIKTSEIHKINEIVNRVGEDSPILPPVKSNNNSTTNYLEIEPTYNYDDIIAYIPVMTGCDQFCSYCIVPYSRGQEIYRNIDDIIGDIKLALKHNKKVIILVGQIVDKWKDSKNNLFFIDLLRKVCKLEADFWLSLMSPHPNYMTYDVIKLIVDEPKMLKYLGLPLQSGSNKILKKMNRNYCIEDYIDKINILRNYFDMSPKNNEFHNYLYLTTDIIVGFPSETQDDYDNTYNLLSTIKYNKVFIAEYSPRPYSLSSTYSDDVSKYDKINRRKKIESLNIKQYSNYNKQLLNKIILVRPTNLTSGISYSNQYVEIENVTPNLVGSICKVKITNASRYGIKGKIV